MNRIPSILLAIVILAILLALGSYCHGQTSSLDLEWNPHPDPSVTHYRVIYGPDIEHLTNYKTVAAPTLTTTITGLLWSTSYLFNVVAYNEGGESPPSNYLGARVEDDGRITILEPPKGAVPALRHVILQSSTDLTAWHDLAALIDAREPRTFYRLIADEAKVAGPTQAGGRSIVPRTSGRADPEPVMASDDRAQRQLARVALEKDTSQAVGRSADRKSIE